MKTGRVTETGIQHLKAWIEATTKSDEAGPLCKTDAKNLDAWACEAEESMANGNPPMVEMDQHSTRSGNPETFTIPADGIDWVDTDD